MATASINLPRAIWGSCKASAVAPGGYTSHRNCSDGWTVTPFVATARFLDRHRWRTRKLELLVSIRVHFFPTSPFPLSSLAANLTTTFLHFRHLVMRVGKKFYPMHSSVCLTHSSDQSPKRPIRIQSWMDVTREDGIAECQLTLANKDHMTATDNNDL